MGTVQEYQPDVDIGQNILLQNLELPHFTDRLLQLQRKTAYTLVSSSLKELEPGHALPVWGAGTNTITQDAKDYIEEIFKKGKQTKALFPSEVVEMMQDAI